jgi:hypothetical protein
MPPWLGRFLSGKMIAPLVVELVETLAGIP